MMGSKIAAFFIFVVGLFLLSSCEKKNVEKYQHNLDEYDSVDDYTISTRDDFRKFLNKYYAKMKEEIPDLKGKDYLVANFSDAGDKIKWYIPWVKASLKKYNERFPIQTVDNIFNFHLFRPAHSKIKGTLVYVHDNLTSPILGWEFLVEYSKYFSDYNFISVDLTNVSRTKVSFTVDELNNVFESELLSFLRRYNLEETSTTINVTCRSFAFAHSFFKRNPSLYNKAIFYTPMVKKSKTDKLVMMSNVYNKEKKEMEYHEMSNFYQLPRGNNQNAKIIPKKHQFLNLTTEYNLSKEFKKGFGLEGIHDRYLIYPEYEDLLSLKTMNAESFDSDKIFMLKGMYHNDYYTNKEKWERYFKVIQQILN